MGSPEELALLEELQNQGKGDADFERAGPFWQLACLRARKHNVARAHELVGNYMRWRDEYGIDETTIHNDAELRALIERGVVIAHDNCDKAGRYVLTVRMSRTDPGRWSPRYAIMATHAAIESLLLRHPEAQSRGIAFVNDMSDIRMGNVDTRVPREMFAAFNSKLPVRFGGIYIVNPPFFMRMIFPMVRMFMKRKMQDRMQMLSNGYPQLTSFFDEDQIPDDMGGTLDTANDDFLPTVERIQKNYGLPRDLDGSLTSVAV
jgi:hypothetical protein